MRIDLVTIFPAYFSVLELSLIGRARAAGLLDVRVHDLRDWTDDPHRTVDDAPFGGGPGMVMRPEPWARALEDLLSGVGDGPGRAAPPRLLLTSPAGSRFDQARAAALAGEPWLVLACGRYEGIDARVAEWAAARMAVEEVSVGDYVLAGGEAAALVVVEAVTRLLPGVVGNAESVRDDSFVGGLLEGPQYTRPARWRGLEVPPVLRSGDHAAVARWRAEQARGRTVDRRPDLAPPLG